MTAPSREVARHWHREHGFDLVADTDEVDIYTMQPRHDGSDTFLLRVLLGGVDLAHSIVLPARRVAATVAHYLNAYDEPAVDCWCDARCEWFGCDCPVCDRGTITERTDGIEPIHHELATCPECGATAELGVEGKCSACYHRGSA